MQQTIIEECQIVFVDCNSQQGEWEKALKWKEEYPDIFTLIKLPEDKGLYNGWNYALRFATGKYISNASMDDRRSPLYAEKLYNFLEDNPDIDVAYTDNFTSHIPNETFEEISLKDMPAYEHGGEHEVSKMLVYNLPHVMPMWKKEIHNKVGVFAEGYPSCGDWEFWLRATFLGLNFKRLPETLGVYFFNPNGLSTNPENDSWKKYDEAYVRNEYTKYYELVYKNKEHTDERFFNWWKTRNWKTHKKDF